MEAKCQKWQIKPLFRSAYNVLWCCFIICSDIWPNYAFWIKFTQIIGKFINVWGKKSASSRSTCTFSLGYTGSSLVLSRLSCEVNFQLTARQYRLTNYIRVAPLYPFQRLSCYHRQLPQLPLQLVLPSAIHDATLRAWQLFATFLKRYHHTFIVGWKQWQRRSRM